MPPPSYAYSRRGPFDGAVSLPPHSWIVFKAAGASSYTRYDYTAWGELPIRVNGFEPDGRWFGHLPELVFAADGGAAEALMPKVEGAIARYN
jgi:hypothetical protein